MADIIGIENMSEADIHREITKGGRFVQYSWCISIIVMTFKRSSDIYFIRADESAVSKGLSYTLLTLILGWWGFPWGPIYSLQCLGTNLSGGFDLTHSFLSSLNEGIDTNEDDSAIDDQPADPDLPQDAVAVAEDKIASTQPSQTQPLQTPQTNMPKNNGGPVIRR